MGHCSEGSIPLSLKTKHMQFLGVFKGLSTKTIFNFSRMTYLGETLKRHFPNFENFSSVCYLLFIPQRQKKQKTKSNLSLLIVSVLPDGVNAEWCFFWNANEAQGDLSGFIKQ